MVETVAKVDPPLNQATLLLPTKPFSSPLIPAETLTLLLLRPNSFETLPGIWRKLRLQICRPGKNERSRSILNENSGPTDPLSACKICLVINFHICEWEIRGNKVLISFQHLVSSIWIWVMVKSVVMACPIVGKKKLAILGYIFLAVFALREWTCKHDFSCLKFRLPILPTRFLNSVSLPS